MWKETHLQSDTDSSALYIDPVGELTELPIPLCGGEGAHYLGQEPQPLLSAF